MAGRVAATAILAGLAPVVLSACQPMAGPVVAQARYEGVETRLLDDGIVNVTVRMTGPATADDLIRYARCAAARYAITQDYGFARHVRTNVYEEGGVRGADAIYTVSPTLPRGLQTIDAEVMAADCAEQGIPTV